MENGGSTQKKMKDSSRESRPADTPLTQSYYHGVCPTPLSGRTLGQVLEMAAIHDPNHVICKVPDYNQEITLGELYQRSRAVAKGLIAMGLRKGDVIMTTGMADMESVVLFYGTVSIGLIMHQPCMRNPVDRYLPKTLKADPSVLFVGPEASDVLTEELKKMWSSPVSGRSDTLKDIIYTANTPDGFSTYSEFLKRGETVTDDTLKQTSNKVTTEDTAFIITTSGSSGEAKLVCQSHCYAVNCSKFTNTRRNPYDNFNVVGVRNPTTDDIQFFISLTQALYWWNESLLIILSSKIEFYNDDVTCLLEGIQNHRMTWYSGYPFELIKMLGSPDLHKYDISSLRGVMLTSYIVSPEDKHRLQQAFPDTTTSYGASEAIVSMTSTVYSSESQKIESVGYPFPHTEVKIVGDDDEVLPIGKAGEVCTRGWFTFSSYYKDTEMTSKTKGMTGWVHLGDIGTMDTTGHIQLVGRKEDCVVFKHTGDKVYPSLILETAKKHLAVKEAKVIGIEDSLIGHEVCLFVELHPGAQLTEKQLQDYFNTELLVLECPTRYFILDAMPRVGARGKVHNQRLKEIAVSKLKD